MPVPPLLPPPFPPPLPPLPPLPVAPPAPPLPPPALLAPPVLLVELATTGLPDAYMGTEPLLATGWEAVGVLTWAAVPAAS